MTPLEHRILDISYRHKLSHIGSCLTAVGIIDDIYSRMKSEDRFVLSCGHAGLALYAVLEKYYAYDAEKLLEHCGTHPERGVQGIHCSTGSLGQGICIALGMAMADRSRDVYCLLSDGECTEGSVYEALNVKRDEKVGNLIVHLNYNQWGAYRTTDWRIKTICDELIIHDTSHHWFMQLYGQQAHYKVLTQQEYEELIRH